MEKGKVDIVKVGNRYLKPVLVAEQLCDSVELIDSRVLKEIKNGNDRLEKMLDGTNRSFVRDYLGLTRAGLKDEVARAALNWGQPPKVAGKSSDGSWFGISAGDEGMVIYTSRRFYDKKPVVVPATVIAALKPNTRLASVQNDIRTEIAAQLIAAEKDGSAWPEQESLPEWLSLVSTDTATAMSLIAEMRGIMFDPVAELVRRYKINRSEMSRQLNIPLRTIEGWCCGESPVKPYMRLLIAEHYWH